MFQPTYQDGHGKKSTAQESASQDIADHLHHFEEILKKWYEKKAKKARIPLPPWHVGRKVVLTFPLKYSPATFFSPMPQFTLICYENYKNILILAIIVLYLNYIF